MIDTAGLSEDDHVELSLLRDFEADALIEAGLLSKSEAQSSPLDRELIFEHGELDLHVTAGLSYPTVPVTWRLENHTLSRTSVDALRGELGQIAVAAERTNNISRWNQREEECALGVFEPAMVVLELARETTKHVEEWRKKTAVSEPKSNLPLQTKQPMPLTTTSGVAYHLLQKTPQEICADIPPQYRVLHVEEVLRPDLARGFHRRQEQMRSDLGFQPLRSLRASVPSHIVHSRRAAHLIEHLVTPCLTFHGTQRQFVPSIVRNGFLKPGMKNPMTGHLHGIRCGATYGQGIYSSPSADFALSYTDWSCHATKPNEFFGIKLIVCATLMGRAASMYREDNWRQQSQPYLEADSHVANRHLEYIVFDSAQIIPVYVIHIDWGQFNAMHFVDLPSDPSQYVPTKRKTHPRLLEDVRWPADIQREKAAILAKAEKYFPYGYGPATGGRFVVEEVGEVDEDDEEYGDYQALRGEEIHDRSNLGFWSWVKAGQEEDAAGDDGAVGEYAQERRAFWPSAWSEIPLPEQGQGEDEDGPETREKDEDDDFGLTRLMFS